MSEPPPSAAIRDPRAVPTPDPTVAPTPDRAEAETPTRELTLRARGDGMRPWLRPGDRLRLERRSPRLGDVALVALGDRLVLQRLVRRRGRGWLVRGEGVRAHRAAYVPADQIVAVATARAGEAGWVRLDGLLGRARALALGPALRAASRLRRRRAPGVPSRSR